jgi:ABC-type sugar transport system substrate-binding protein
VRLIGASAAILTWIRLAFINVGLAQGVTEAGDAVAHVAIVSVDASPAILARVATAFVDVGLAVNSGKAGEASAHLSRQIGSRQKRT